MLVVMACSKYACWSNVARGSLAAMLLAIAGFAAAPAGAEIIRKEDTLRGITMTREECAAKPQTFWLNVYSQDFCVRYYLSTAGGQGSRPVIILNGDHNGPVDPTRWTWADPSKASDVNTDKLVGYRRPFFENGEDHGDLSWTHRRRRHVRHPSVTQDPRSS